MRPFDGAILLSHVDVSPGELVLMWFGNPQQHNVCTVLKGSMFVTPRRRRINSRKIQESVESRWEVMVENGN